MMIHAAMALPLILVGWFGFAMRRTAIGGVISLLVAWQGLLAFGALIVFQREKAEEGALLLWTFTAFSVVILITVLGLALRQYYALKNVKWEENERIRH
jgi:heme/copper-type cytochrome/quinol oxidase subunit 2